MKQKLFLLFILLFTMTGFSNEKTNKKIRQNEELVHNFFETLNSYNTDKLVLLFSEDGTYEEVCSSRLLKGRDAIVRYINVTLKGIPDSKFEIETIVANEYHATVEWIWTGTNTVGWPDMNIPATGKFIKLKGISVMDIENGKIKSNRDYWDWNSFLKGIGVN